MKVLEILCHHIAPQAYAEDETSGKSTDFASDIVDMIGRELTPEELATVTEEPIEIYDDDDIDTIERVN